MIFRMIEILPEFSVYSHGIGDEGGREEDEKGVGDFNEEKGGRERTSTRLHQTAQETSYILNMPFISKDWRSPGEEWVKTEEGWEKKKILECGRQIFGQSTENMESR